MYNLPGRGGTALVDSWLKSMGYRADRMTLKSGLLLVSLSVWVVAPQVRGQVPLNAADSAKVEHFLDSGQSHPPLNCSIEPRKPFLDFAFRFDVGYILRCPLRAFGGRESTVLDFVRVTPQVGKPLILGESHRVPGIPPEQAAAPNARKLKGEVEVSGGFAVGEGWYQVEVLLMDPETGRTSRKRWSVRVARSHSEQAVVVGVPRGTATPMAFRPWQGKLDTSGKGLRLTILLDAAPIYPYAQKLRAWDRAALLGSLSTLLGQIPCASVRLIAFNLDQQREVFRQDDFADAGFMKLAEALRTLELGTVSYRVLQQRQGWLDMLVNFANREVTAANPSDAVIILGPHVRYYAGVPREMLKVRETPNPHFCYFEYLPGVGQLPDTLQILTKRLDGTVYEIHSAGDFARAIQNLLARVQPSGGATVDSRWPPRPAPPQ
ncbi:MAG: hypothetical protein ABSA41_18320 [Terriglobia bacterium]